MFLYVTVPCITLMCNHWQLDPRISVLRGETKSIAASNTRAFYGLEDGCMARVQTLLAGNYIFPRTNGVSVTLRHNSNPDLTICQDHGYYQYNKPFEHLAIVSTLRDDLFSSSYPITRVYSYRFLPGQEDGYSRAIYGCFGSDSSETFYLFLI